MTIDELKQRDFNGKNVLIIGCPASGKSFLAGQLNFNRLIETDDYKKYGYKESLYAVLGKIRASDGPSMIEGILGYRLLRKGLQRDCYYPDVVIEMIVSEQRMLKTYSKERDPKKIRYLKGFNAAHNTILEEYKKMPNKNPPEWIKVSNNY